MNTGTLPNNTMGSHGPQGLYHKYIENCHASYNFNNPQIVRHAREFLPHAFPKVAPKIPAPLIDSPHANYPTTPASKKSNYNFHPNITTLQPHYLTTSFHSPQHGEPSQPTHTHPHPAYSTFNRLMGSFDNLIEVCVWSFVCSQILTSISDSIPPLQQKAQHSKQTSKEQHNAFNLINMWDASTWDMKSWALPFINGI